MRTNKDFNKLWFIDLRKTGFKQTDPAWQKRLDSALLSVLDQVKGFAVKAPVLIKPHIGEPKGVTFTRPGSCASVADFVRDKGVSRIVCGDTVVIYSGERGFKENPEDDCKRYLKLASARGWDEKGPLKTPYVVLDRPHTSVKGVFEFDKSEIVLKDKTGRYSHVFSSGGYQAAGSIINMAHLTLHPVAHFACAIKNISMGGAAYNGKITLHRHYFPKIDPDKCLQCGMCAASCPIEALKWKSGEVPKLVRELCLCCGECLSVCNERGNAISMAAESVSDWASAENIMQFRLIDYAVGLINKRWDNLLNISLLYDVTKNCDCFDIVQQPIVDDIGVVVCQNPFAADFYTRYLLAAAMTTKKTDKTLAYESFKNGENPIKDYFPNDQGLEPLQYAKKEFGFEFEPTEIVTVKI